MSPSPEVLAAAEKSATPAMRQYFDAKRQYPNALIFFRMGDFYEMFYDDAVTASRALELTLTSRSKDSSGIAIPMCGVPHHAADGYLARLVKQGFRVALCEQVENPKKAKGLVRREVVRVVSPGTLTDANYLSDREPVFLMALAEAHGSGETTIGVASADLSTGELHVTEHAGKARANAVADELASVAPRELLLPLDFDSTFIPGLAETAILITTQESWIFGLDHATHTLTEHLGTSSLEGFGLNASRHPAAIAAAGALLHYLRDTQKADLSHFRTLDFRTRTDFLVIDPATFKHLEILDGADGGAVGSLIGEIDATTTAMGGRLLRTWLLRPLTQLDPILERLNAVEELVAENTTRAKLRDVLSGVYDLERLVARIVLGTTGPRDLVTLAVSVGAIPMVRTHGQDFHTPLLRALVDGLDDVADVRDQIQSTLVDEPPALTRDGGAIRPGVDHELDELRSISQDAKQSIAALEDTERKRTGIASLKVRFNRVFGYYIEVSRSKLDAVPEDYHRKQTISSGERFITPVLKDYERKALGADERILEREQELFDTLCKSVVDSAERIQRSARGLAVLDVLSALGETATRRNYTKPCLHDGYELLVSDGRHPVVERRSEAFVPNDILLDEPDRHLVVLTGPNMGGKSTYLRQTAVIVLMAHVGSFVPVRQAKIPIIDRIFARVGASDNIARGQSTFMVEMQETAQILHLATSRSLVLLDEIGRGTATFDGLSIAWAVAEHLATDTRARPKTLFATHYHELTDLADTHSGVVNYHVAAREWEDDIVFLHKVEPGRSDRSYGIQVARLAGLPPTTIARAKVILAGLEGDELDRGGQPTFSVVTHSTGGQLGLFQRQPTRGDRLAARLTNIEVEQMTPADALSLLADLKRELDD